MHLLNHCAHTSNKINPEYTLATLCDLSKAFDVISYNIQLQKLNNYGIIDIANTLFENYLSDRTQYVELGNSKSSLREKSVACHKGPSWVPYFILFMLMILVNQVILIFYLLPTIQLYICPIII